MDVRLAKMFHENKPDLKFGIFMIFLWEIKTKSFLIMIHQWSSWIFEPDIFAPAMIPVHPLNKIENTDIKPCIVPVV